MRYMYMYVYIFKVAERRQACMSPANIRNMVCCKTLIEMHELHGQIIPVWVLQQIC